jgi:chorismate synthase
MSGNSFGHLFRISTFGESHGPGVGTVIDGCPAGLLIDPELIQQELDRRRPGQTAHASPRQETDRLQILSGVFENKTTGSPIALFIANGDARPEDYAHLKDNWRPGHADMTYSLKYGHRDHRGGGRSSARETAARVMAGALAKQLLAHAGIEISAYVSSIGPHSMPTADDFYTREEVDASTVRCPHPATSEKMIHFLDELRTQGDTCGGIITCISNGVPAGLGNPVFHKLQADLAHAMLGINAAKGFESGDGFAAAGMLGSLFNDAIEATVDESGHPKFHTQTNHSGGIQGGISNGSPVVFRVAFRPVSTIMQDQQSVDSRGNAVNVEGKGRHDACVVPRAVPIVEAMCALVLADHLLLNRSARI